MRLEQLPTYVQRVQACAADLRGLWARLEGEIRSTVTPAPATPAAPTRARQRSSSSSSSSAPPGPSYGFQSPAPASSPRLPPPPSDADATAYARRLIKLCDDLGELAQAFSACATVTRKLRTRFAGERCSSCPLHWVECRKIELQHRGRCCGTCSHGRRPRTL